MRRSSASAHTIGILRGLEPRWLIRIAFYCALGAGPAFAKTSTLVKPTHNVDPQYATTPNPSARDLIETWRASNKFLPGKRVDRERFAILDHRVLHGRVSRAFLQFRIIGTIGDARAWAAARCAVRKQPVEIQVFYQWSNDIGSWVPLSTRGDGQEDLCANRALWRSDQIEALIDPPPLPTPRKISQADVETPPSGSPVRAAVLAALRPRYERYFGGKITFRVDTLRIAVGFAFVVVHPQRPDGKPIARSMRKHALGIACFQDPRGVTHEYWMRQEGGTWKVALDNDMCADDSIVDQGDLIGAPPLLAQKDVWPARDIMPELK